MPRLDKELNDRMKRKCDKCSNRELVIETANAFRFGVPALQSLLKVEVEYVCPRCGQKSGTEQVLTDTGQFQPHFAIRGDASIGEVRHRHATLFNFPSVQSHTTLQYPAVFRVGDNVLLPTSEGNLQDGTVIDQHGDPDLMVEFAEEYFNLYRLITARTKSLYSLIKIMPALQLLVIATELAMKAYLIRAEKQSTFRHSLRDLYEDLDPKHRNKIERQFAKTDLNSNLAALGVDAPAVETILKVYDETYGGESSVYKDSRFYAEPTTTFKPSSNLHGASLVKSHNPYPIFLPDVARALIDTYRFYSGHERLRRRGANVEFGAREPVTDNHGEWGLVPSSLGLVVVSVPQRAGKSAMNEKLKAFRTLMAENPPGFRTDWMYGGNILLFYDAGGDAYPDGHNKLNGVECRFWSNKRLGLHARDLYRLADVVESRASLGCLNGLSMTDYEST